MNDGELVKKVEPKQEFQFQLEDDNVKHIDPDEVQELDGAG